MQVIFTYEDGSTDVIEHSRLGRYLHSMYSHDGEEYVTAYYNEFGLLNRLTLVRHISAFDENDYATVNFVFTKPNGDTWAYGGYTIDGRA